MKVHSALSTHIPHIYVWICDDSMQSIESIDSFGINEFKR